MPPKNWGQIYNMNRNNRQLEEDLRRLQELDEEADEPPRLRRPPAAQRVNADQQQERGEEQRALEPVRRGAPGNVPPRKAPPRAPQVPPPRPQQNRDDDDDEDEMPQPRPRQNRDPFEVDEEDEEEDEEQNMMMMRQPPPRPGQQQRGRNMIVRAPANVRRQNEPTGNIRYANGQLRSAVSWMFTIRLSNDPRRVNYFPYEQDPRRMQRVNGRYRQPYVIPTLASLVGRRNAPVYLLYQLEQGNNGVLGHNGLPLHENLHYQGFMEFGSKVSAIEICVVMGWLAQNGWNMGDVWLEPRQGRKEDAIAYVTKDDTAFAIHDLIENFAIGVLTAEEFQDGVNELEEGEDGPLEYFRREEGQQRPPDAADMAGIVTNMIQEGATYHDILMAYPSYALQRTYGIKAAIDAISEKKGGKLKHRDVKTFVFWGDSRTGKSRKISEMEGDQDLVMDQNKVYVKNRKEHYYQHYTDQEVLVLDEFVGSHGGDKMTIDDLLQILDGQNLSLAIKHSSPRFARWTKVYITSNIPPRLWFPNAPPGQLEAMYRRLETGGIWKFVDTDKPASVEAHDAEVISQTYLRDRANVVMRSSAWP